MKCSGGQSTGTMIPHSRTNLLATHLLEGLESVRIKPWGSNQTGLSMDICSPTPVARRRHLAAILVVTGIALTPLPGQAEPSLGPENEECTIAVLSSKATPDGRPVLWKNRDTGVLNNEVVYFNDGIYPYVALVNAGESYRAWMGLNDQGFAILNALSYNLPDSINMGITNGELMKLALQSCATIADFELLLAETNDPGRKNPANIAVMDAVGGATVFEVGNRCWRRFDADDPSVAPDGFLVRTNFSFSADTSGSDTYRYHRCRRLLEDATQARQVAVSRIVRNVARDIRSSKVNPYPLPYEGTPPGYPKAIGYVDAGNTINRRTTAAAAVIHGVVAGENSLLSTFYAILGQPAVGIALPVWVAAGATPQELDGPKSSPVCDLAVERMLTLYDHPTNGSLLNTYNLYGNDRTSPLALAERVDRYLFQVVEEQMRIWRKDGPDVAAMAQFQAQTASDAFTAYQGGPLPGRPAQIAIRTSPNPTRNTTVIRYETDRPLPEDGWIDLIDPCGRRIRRLMGCEGNSPEGCITWDGRDGAGRLVAAGVYFVKPSWGAPAQDGSVIILR